MITLAISQKAIPNSIVTCSISFFKVYLSLKPNGLSGTHKFTNNYGTLQLHQITDACLVVPQRTHTPHFIACGNLTMVLCNSGGHLENVCRVVWCILHLKQQLLNIWFNDWKPVLWGERYVWFSPNTPNVRQSCLLWRPGLTEGSRK